MPLIASSLSNSLFSIFDGMNGRETTDKWFADEVTNAVKDYFEGASGSTTDAGTISAGAFTGMGTVSSISASPSACSSLIFAALTSMRATGDNNTLATAMATGFMTMFNDGVVTCNVTGTASTPTSISTVSGTSQGSVATKSASMYNDILSAFNDMNCKSGESLDSWKSRMGGDPNRYMADKIANTVTTELKSAVLTCYGTGALSGETGVGNLS